ncbi:uncharacterized protein LOC143588289 isoform X1 [Bidens hawaiensis]|uniref:uncharacterized protein LOC143588289 isoform X1 n=1 Tax=Bidens hawaiensis TaxID=980011 RepID=UPI004048EFA5
MVSREIENAITELRALLEHEKASIETKMAKARELWKAQVDIDSCLKYMSVQIEEGKEKVTDISLKLEEIKELLGELHASNTTIIQPSFSTLYAEADIVTKLIKDCIKMNCDESQRRLSECFHELATTLQPSS